MDLISYCFDPNEVFEGRNKAYGAYRMRVAYSRRLSLALCAGVALFTLGMASPVILNRLAPAGPAVHNEGGTAVDLSRPPDVALVTPALPPIIPLPPPPPAVKEFKYLPPEPTREDLEHAFEDIPSQDDLATAQASTLTTEGDPNADIDRILPEGEPSPHGVLAPPGPERDEPPILIAEQMPAYPGGAGALAQFLQREVRYPEIARKAGVEGRVYLQFIVGKDGIIRDVQVMRGPGGGLNEEAVRVVEAMPAWIPGRQNGRAVPVRFSMPIIFKLK